VYLSEIKVAQEQTLHFSYFSYVAFYIVSPLTFPTRIIVGYSCQFPEQRALFNQSINHRILKWPLQGQLNKTDADVCN